MSRTFYLAFADEEFQDTTVPKQKIMDLANLHDGWCKRENCTFEYTQNHNQASAVLHIWPNARIEKKFPTMSGFSVTEYPSISTPPDTASSELVNYETHQPPPPRPPRIYFNLDNIQHPPKTFRGSKEDYLRYVVQHELGHAIFNIREHDAEDDRHPVTRMCSIMYQQTKGTNHCTPGHAFYHGRRKRSSSSILSMYNKKRRVGKRNKEGRER